MEDDREEDDHRPTTAMEVPHPTEHETPSVVTDDDEAEGDYTVEDVPLGPGAEVGGYVIDAEIGKGGMGHVYSATHPVIGKRAAIKILRAEVSKTPVVLERFIQEARAVNQIGHPNIIDIFAFGQLPDGRAYHVMDLLVGESLRKRIKRGPLNPSEAAAIIDDVASALTAAHAKGFVHRDLKPDNVFLLERPGTWPEVKLLDFGLAKLMPEGGVQPFTTKTGVMLGTPEYMSPEQARGTGVDYRTDIYALGVLTFELLAGQRPFPSGNDAFATMQAHIEQPPPSLRALMPHLPEEMTQLVDAMLAKEPGARPSLAAVRSVIKRLRTTQLPSRTEAAMRVAVPEMSSAGLRTSGLADDAADAAQTNLMLRRSPAYAAAMSTPPTAIPALRQVPAPAPSPSSPSYADLRYSQPSIPSGGSEPVPSYQSVHVYQPSPLGVAPPVIAQTRLGVEPARVVTARANVEVPPASQLWLILGALCAIAVGVAIAIAIV